MSTDDTFDRILGMLENVHRTGDDRFTARCPAHTDKHRSFGGRLLADGRILLNCFAQCEISSVLAALGLEMKDLFPKPLTTTFLPGQRPNLYHAAREAFRAVHFEVLLVAISAENVANGIALSDDDRDRLILAAQRIRSAAEAVQ